MCEDSTAGMVRVPLVVTTVVVTHPWLTLHHALGCEGCVPPPFHEPPDMRHQLPTPSDE